MSLSVGIIGLPNVGKSTIMNALSGSHHAAAENYPFCTVEPNHAAVAVPDDRLEKIAALTSPEKITPTGVEFVDIAGLVKNASQGEGLGNQFLASMGEADALLHVVRCFADDNVAHVTGAVDPVGDIEIVETELLLRDIQMLENRLAKLRKEVRNDKSIKPLIEPAAQLLEHLQGGAPVLSFGHEGHDAIENLLRDMRFLTGKPTVYCANTDEDGLTDDSAAIIAIREHAVESGAEVMVMAARIEEELVDMTAEERLEFLSAYGIADNALARLIRASYAALGLVSFFTIQSNQVQAWTVRGGTRAPQAAGVIHADFEKGFIRAEVMSYTELVAHGGEPACRSAGAIRTEGKDYVVQDGDIIRFLCSS